MSATAIAQAAIKYAPQAISIAKNLAQKFAPNMLAAVESSLPVESIALLDNGYSRFTYLAKQAISEDRNFANNLQTLSTHLSESHPTLANRISNYAAKALNKAGLSDEEISFLHEHLTKISSSESDVKPETVKGQPTAEDVHILIDLIAKGGLEPSVEAAYVETLNHQTAVPLTEVKQRLIEASEKHHPSEPVPEETSTINNSGVEQSSSVSILDDSLTTDQQKVIIDAAKRISLPLRESEFKDFGELVEKNITLEGKQNTLSVLGNQEPNFFPILTTIASGGKVSLSDFKITISNLTEAFGIKFNNLNSSLNDHYDKYSASINQTEPKQIENTESRVEPESKSSSSTTNGTSTHLDSLVANIRDVLVREVKGSSTLFGMAQRAVGAAKGMGITLPKSLEGMEDIGKVLDSLVLTDTFKSSLERSIKGERIDFQGSNELQTRAFQIINWGVWSINKLPKVAIEYFPLAVNVMKWAMPVARFIPFIGGVLCTAYPVLDEVAKVIDKFQVEAENIRTACTAIKGEKSNNTEAASETNTETAKAPEQELVTAVT